MNWQALCKTRRMKKKHYLLLAFAAFGCQLQNTGDNSQKNSDDKTEPLSETEIYYRDHVNDSLPSKSHGTVSKGSLENATLIPFEGTNYKYFDKSSYLGGRAYTHSVVAEITLATYASLEKLVDRQFRVMEFSCEKGGKIFPHKTHQNGLSVDFMIPLKKDNAPYYGLDNKGASHYLLDFDHSGKYSEDPTISIDFNMAAQHILELDQQARKKGMRIEKVIFNTFLKDELFASEYGRKLAASGIYITHNLTPIINDLHDDHFHVDFTPL